jgi:hypothetical protein
MKATKETVVSIVLELDEEDAHWLRGVMQNPLHGQEPGEEDPEEQRRRHDLWTELNNAILDERD